MESKKVGIKDTDTIKKQFGTMKKLKIKMPPENIYKAKTNTSCYSSYLFSC